MENIKKNERRYIINTYNRSPEKTLLLVDGEGVVVRDDKGREYFDFLGGLAVTALGHCHPRVVEAIKEQAGRIVHTSNLYYTVPQIELAQLLIENSTGESVFFANSGAEANEAAIKLARKYAWKKYGDNKYEIITAYNSFHGRTMATLAATGQKKFQQGFSPLLPGFRYATFNDLDSFTAAVTDNTCAIMVEVVQGEGGVYVSDPDFLVGLRQLCDQKGLLLIFDEVQCGMGRTGKMWAYEHFNVIPDIFTSAKALANGLPIGAMIAGKKASSGFAPGDHASTFGGNPVSCAAAVATIKTILEEGFLNAVKERGAQLQKGLSFLQSSIPGKIKEIRGLGLIVGFELETDGAPDLQSRLLEKGYLVNAIGNRTIRCLPPYIITADQVERFLEILGNILPELNNN